MWIRYTLFIMDFFKNKVKNKLKKYQEQKLDEILFKIQFHESTKIELEKKMKQLPRDDVKLAKDIAYHAQMVDIWIGNEKKLRKQMADNERD
jgi:hypothetical protein